MKKIILALTVLAFSVISSFSQKVAFVDTEYILSSIPTYESAQKQLEDLSKKLQVEVDDAYGEIEKMYKEYQTEKVFLSEEMKTKREEDIIAKEKLVKDLQKKYFGREGDLYKKRTELIKPLQDEIYNAIKELAIDGDYGVIFDSASGGASILYSDPKYDKSDEVLKKLGYGN